MSDVREVSLFRNGRNQAVRIPRDMEMSGDKVRLWLEGDRIVIEPIASSQRDRLLALVRTFEPIEEELELPDDPPPEAEDIFGDRGNVE